jgi:hypothetical protein
MTEPHQEPSYYEIALTNRQVVVAFVILLVCLLSAFFSGVWIGRGGGDRNGAEPVGQLARATPPEPTEGRNLEELKFFSDETASKRRGKKGGDEPPAETSPAPAPQEPVAKAPQPAPPPALSPAHPVTKPPAAAPSRPAVPASVAPAAPPVDDDGAVVRSRPLPDQVTEAGKPAGRKPASGASGASGAASDNPSAQAGTGSVVIQVFASADPNEARKMRDRLAGGGERAFVSPLTVDGRTMYRVRVGPFASRAVAQKEADRVRKAYKLDTWLTE